MMQILHLFTLPMSAIDEGLHHSQGEANFFRRPPGANVGFTVHCGRVFLCAPILSYLNATFELGHLLPLCAGEQII
jgi:hypothetical protein